MQVHQTVITGAKREATEQLEEAKRLLKDGAVDKAGPLLVSLLAEDPENTNAQYCLGLCHLMASRLKGAELIFRAILKKEPNHAQAHYELGLVLEKDNRPLDAIKHWKLAKEAAPEFVFPRKKLQEYNALVADPQTLLGNLVGRVTRLRRTAEGPRGLPARVTISFWLELAPGLGGDGESVFVEMSGYSEVGSLQHGDRVEVVGHPGRNKYIAKKVHILGRGETAEVKGTRFLFRFLPNLFFWGIVGGIVFFIAKALSG